VGLQVDPKSGLICGARQIASPNHDARPAGVEADLIVVHGISLPPGEFGGPWIDRLFTNTLPPDVHPYFAEVCSMRVSSHLVLDRDGAVTQYVSLQARAWHAGKSTYEGRAACNDFSVGVELEGTDTFRTRPSSTMPWRSWWPPCVLPIRGFLRTAWWAIAILPPAVKPIPDRLSIGRARAGWSPLPAACRGGVSPIPEL